MKPWTRAEEKTLVDGKRAGRKMADIAADIPGRSYSACKSKWMSMSEFIQIEDRPRFDDHPKADMDRKSTPIGWVR